MHVRREAWRAEVRIADCPICGDIGGFHHDDCGASWAVPKASLLPLKEDQVRVKLTPEEIAQLRAEAAQRKQEKERTG